MLILVPTHLGMALYVFPAARFLEAEETKGRWISGYATTRIRRHLTSPCLLTIKGPKNQDDSLRPLKFWKHKVWSTLNEAKQDPPSSMRVFLLSDCLCFLEQRGPL